MPRDEVRRGSHSTVSEPASEPRGQGEDMEAKRRRILPPLPEAQDEGRERERAAASITHLLLQDRNSSSVAGLRR